MNRYIIILRTLCTTLAVAASWAFVCTGETCTDEELRHDVLDFLTTRYCGSFGGGRVLTNEIRFDGNTNRLACVLSEFAFTNDERIATRAVRQIGEYGTSAQLPFLYSCTTNPIIGERAVKSILNIEGVTSNSVAAANVYLSHANLATAREAYDKAVFCRDFLRLIGNMQMPVELHDLSLQVVRNYSANISIGSSMIDEALIAADATYRFSRRRLADLRAAYPRCFNEFQTTYVTNAINELVAYPEANLSD